MRVLKLILIVALLMFVYIPSSEAKPTQSTLNLKITESKKINLIHGHRCQDFTVNDHQFFGENQTRSTNPEHATAIYSLPIHQSIDCKLQNLWGAVGGNISAFEADPDQPYRVRNNSGWSIWHANGTDTTLSLKHVAGRGESTHYKVAVTKKHLSKSSTSYYKDSQNRWLRRLDIPNPDPHLEYEDGTTLKVKGAFITTSGRYVALDIYQRGLAVYDTYLKTLTPVSNKFGRDNINTRLSLSEDGRYLVVSGRLKSNRTNYELLLFDVSSCENKSLSSIASTGEFAPKSCVALDLKQYISNHYEAVLRSGSVWTNPNKNEIVVDVLVKNGNQQQLRTLSLTPNNDTQPVGYLAMGDSYSSGEGDGDGDTWYEPDTDNQGDRYTYLERNICHLSRRSYPYLLAQQLGYDIAQTTEPDALFHSVACSGAKIHNIIGGNLGDKHSPGNADEFSRTDNQYIFNSSFKLNHWQPGSTKQIRSISAEPFSSRNVARKMNPEIITIGISGNDAGFVDFLNECVSSAKDCDQTDNSSDAAYKTTTRIASQKRRLVDVFKQLKNQSNARVYVHGYPVLFTTKESYCANVPLSQAERSFANSATKYLNQIIETAADEAGVVYVDVEEMFNGQRLCNKSQNLLNGATIGNDIFRIPIINKWIIGKESFHPTQHGFIKYRSTITNQTNGLSKPMPDPQPNLKVPLPNRQVFGDRGVEYVEKLNNIHDYTQLPIPEQRKMIIDPIKDDFKIKLNGLEPDATAIVEIHSTPTKLAELQVKPNGTITNSLKLPKLEPGYHELHVKTTAVDGQKTDYYESFVIAYSATDFDGDNIPNQQDGCPLIPGHVQQDQDKDGLEDLCDLFINDNPGDDSPAIEQVEALETVDNFLNNNQIQTTTLGPNRFSNDFPNSVANANEVKTATDSLKNIVKDADKPSYNWKVYVISVGGIAGLVLLIAAITIKRK